MEQNAGRPMNCRNDTSISIWLCTCSRNVYRLSQSRTRTPDQHTKSFKMMRSELLKAQMPTDHLRKPKQSLPFKTAHNR